MSESSKSKNIVTTQIDEWGRRKFHLEEHEASPQEPTPQQAEAARNKSMLVQRQEGLNIEKYVGRIEKNQKNKKKEVFYCEVCKEGFKCDLAYITHLNSPFHNRKLGMSMKVKAVSTESVMEKLKVLKESKNPTQKGREIKQETKKEEVKAESQENQQIEDKEASEEDDIEAELLAMGLPTSFGSKKQKR